MKISKDVAGDLLCLAHGHALQVDDRWYWLVDQLDTIIDPRRWATIRRTIFKDMAGRYWALDWEDSDSETHEPWSYIEPELKPTTKIEKVVTIWVVEG